MARPTTRRDHLLRDAYLVVTVTAERTRNELEAICLGHGLTIAQYPILWTLCLGGHPEGLAMSQLADGLVTKGADTTRLVSRLVDAGYVVRSSSPGDRRKVLVSVTDEGRRAFEAVTPEIKAAHRRQFAQLSDAQLEQLTAALNTTLWSTPGEAS